MELFLKIDQIAQIDPILYQVHPETVGLIELLVLQAQDEKLLQRFPIAVKGQIQELLTAALLNQNLRRAAQLVQEELVRPLNLDLHEQMHLQAITLEDHPQRGVVEDQSRVINNKLMLMPGSTPGIFIG